VRFCFLFINPNPLTGFAVLRLIREAIGLDNQRKKLHSSIVNWMPEMIVVVQHLVTSLLNSIS